MLASITTVLLMILLVFYPVWLGAEDFKMRAIIFVVELIIISFIGVSMHRDESRKKPEKTLRSKKKGRLGNVSLVAFIVITALLISQLILSFMPLTLRSDEDIHTGRGLALYQGVEMFYEKLHLGISYGTAFIIGTVIIIMLIILLRKQLYALLSNRKFPLLLMLLILMAVAYFGMVNMVFQPETLADASIARDDLPGNEILSYGLTRYGTVMPSLYFFSLSFFGLSEFSVRIFSVLFFILSGFMLYMIASLFQSRPAALSSALFLLLMPTLFYFGHFSYVTTPLLFFFLLTTYYFIKYEMTKNVRDLQKFSLAFLIGFLIKDPMILLLGGIWLYLVVRSIFAKKWHIGKFLKQHADLIKYSVLVGIIILFWSVLTRYYGTSIYGFAFEIWTYLPSAVKYIKLVPFQITWVLLSVAIIALLIKLKEIKHLSKPKEHKPRPYLLFLILFFVFQIIITTSHRGCERVLIPSLIIFPLLGGYFIDWIPEKKKLLKKMIILFIVALMAINLLAYAIPNHNGQYHPLNEAFSAIKELPEDSKVLITMGPNPYRFYIEKYSLNDARFIRTFWEEEPDQNVENLYAFMKQNNIEYALFPTPTTYWGTIFPSTYINNEMLLENTVPWTIEKLNEDMLRELQHNTPEGFTLLKTFKKGDNEMMLIQAEH